MTEVYICEAVRTPIGRFGGALSGVRADDLAAHAIASLVAQVPALDPSHIDDVVFGCANQAGEDNRNVARMGALLAGLPREVGGVTVNRLCASGAEAVVQAARAIRAGEADLIVAGGVESMSRAPYVLSKARGPLDRGQTLEDTVMGWRFVNPEMAARYGVETMPETAENVARLCGISRETQDRFAAASQRKAAAAQASDWFAQEIAPVMVPAKSGATAVGEDEHPRPGTDLEALARLKPVVSADGTVTAGNASGINDGAAALLVASAAAAERQGLVPRAKLLGAAVAGVEPSLMGLGPVPATRKLLDRLGLGIAEFDWIEINEAFAAQVVACLGQLGVDPFDGAVNPRGGAIALGHPLGMSGARLVQSSAHALGDGLARRALVTMCVGVGQGLSIALERVSSD